MSRRDRKHLPSRAILTASSSHVTGRRPAEAGLAETTAPRRPRGAGGAEPRPGARPDGASGRAGTLRRRRMRGATVPPVKIRSASLSFPLAAPQAGARCFHFSLHTWHKLSFPFVCYRCFSPQVRRGAGPLLGRRLLGSSRPSTPAGPGLLGTLSRPFLLPRAACSLGALSPVTVCGGAVPFLVSTGTERGRGDPFLSPGVRGCGRRGPPETTPALPAISLERVCCTAREPRAVGWE